jgi:hypothetical protein
LALGAVIVAAIADGIAIIGDETRVVLGADAETAASANESGANPVASSDGALGTGTTGPGFEEPLALDFGVPSGSSSPDGSVSLTNGLGGDEALGQGASSLPGAGMCGLFPCLGPLPDPALATGSSTPNPQPGSEEDNAAADAGREAVAGLAETAIGLIAEGVIDDYGDLSEGTLVFGRHGDGDTRTDFDAEWSPDGSLTVRFTQGDANGVHDVRVRIEADGSVTSVAVDGALVSFTDPIATSATLPAAPSSCPIYNPTCWGRAIVGAAGRVVDEVAGLATLVGGLLLGDALTAVADAQYIGTSYTPPPRESYVGQFIEAVPHLPGAIVESLAADVEHVLSGEADPVGYGAVGLCDILCGLAGGAAGIRGALPDAGDVRHGADVASAADDLTADVGQAASALDDTIPMDVLPHLEQVARDASFDDLLGSSRPLDELGNGSTEVSGAAERSGLVDSYIRGADIDPAALPYGAGVRPPRDIDLDALPQSIEEAAEANVREITSTAFASDEHGGAAGVVRLGQLDDGSPVALKTVVPDGFPGATAADIEALANQVLLQEVQRAQIASDLGIGPRYHGVVFDAEGRPNVVTDIVPGDAPGVSSNITAQTVRDLDEILRRLEESPLVSIGNDFQYHVTPDGRG